MTQLHRDRIVDLLEDANRSESWLEVGCDGQECCIVRPLPWFHLSKMLVLNATKTIFFVLLGVSVSNFRPVNRSGGQTNSSDSIHEFSFSIYKVSIFGVHSLFFLLLFSLMSAFK